MAHFRCPSCHAKAPAAGEMFMRIPAPGTDSCPKCGADLLQPALEKLDEHPTFKKTPEEIVNLGHTDRHSRTKALSLRAQLHERMGQAEQAERDRHQAIDELSRAIADHQDDDVLKLVALLQWRGHVHEEAGRQVEGVRDDLRALDAQEGTFSEAGVAAGFLAGGSGWAAKAGAEHATHKMVSAGRKELINAGKAVGIGFCQKCDQLVSVTPQGRCPAAHEVELRRYVVPEDAEKVGAELTRLAAGGNGASASAGWLPDPLERHDYRYWDGTRWTENVSDAGEQSVDPVDSPAGARTSDEG